MLRRALGLLLGLIGLAIWVAGGALILQSNQWDGGLLVLLGAVCVAAAFGSSKGTRIRE